MVNIMRSVAAALGPMLISSPLFSQEQEFFHTSDQCIACHSGVVSPHGQDISIGYTWRASMMANSARDPYWQAGVRREVMDHPGARAAIEDTCATCHTLFTETLGDAGEEVGILAEQVPYHEWLHSDYRTTNTCQSCHMPELVEDAPITSVLGQLRPAVSQHAGVPGVGDRPGERRLGADGRIHAGTRRGGGKPFRAQAAYSLPLQAVLAAHHGDDFTAGGDRVQFLVNVSGASGAITVSVELLFQSIGYRWAENLRDYDAFETNRFVGCYEESAASSSVMLAGDSFPFGKNKLTGLL